MLVSLTGIVLFTYMSPQAVVSPHGWDWRAVTEGPTDAVATGTAGRFQPVRALESTPGAVYAVELLATTGLLGVAAGPPATHANATREVLIVPADRCSGVESLRAHADSGGRILLVGPCEELRAAFGLPEPAVWAEPAPEGSVDLAGGRSLRNLPLPTRGREWVEPAGWEVLARRVQGGALIIQRGSVVATSLDLVSWLRALRQGDPELAGVDTDGVHGTKPNDLRPFPWSSPAWRQPGGDAWTELLAWLVGERMQDHPLPRIWPLTTPAPSALILTADQDFAEPDWIEPLLARTEAAGGELTLLTTEGTRQNNKDPVDAAGGTMLSGASLGRARLWGHGIGLHPNGAGLRSPRDIQEAIASHHGRAVDALLPHELRVARHHYLQWWGYSEPMDHLASLGIWMELNFVSIEPRLRGPGFQFGSGRPARWQAPEGRLLPILSQPTQVEDDVLIGEYGYSANLSEDRAALASAYLLDASAPWRVPVTANVHPTLVMSGAAVLLDGLLAAASERGLPILSAERWATWSWHRLRTLQSASLRPTPTGWEVTHSPSAVPLLLWTPGPDCEAPVTPSPLGPPGCLSDWAASNN